MNSRGWLGALAAVLCAGAASCGESAAPTEAGGASAVPAFTISGAHTDLVRVEICAAASERLPGAAVIEARWDPEVARYADEFETTAALMARADASVAGRLRIAALSDVEAAQGSTCVGSFLLELIGAPGARSAIEMKLVETIISDVENGEIPALASPGLIRIVR